MRCIVGLSLGLVALACAEGPPCARGGCPERTVCELDGTCRAQAPDAVETSSALSVAAVDWGVVRRHELHSDPAGHDVLSVGGADGAVAYLAFGPLPTRRELVRAVLTLHVDSSTRRGVRGLRVWRTRPFDGPGLAEGHRPRHRRGYLSTRAVEATPASPLHIEVTELVRGSQRDEEDRLYLELRVARRGPEGELRVASPSCTDGSERPSLALLLR